MRSFQEASAPRARVAWFGLVLIGLVACASPASPSSQAPATPPATRTQEFTVLMGPDNDGTQLNAYFPGSLTARPGDTIVFENRSIAPHTITFGLEPDPLTWPPLASPDGQPNPVAVAPCTTDQAPAAATSCANDPAAPLPAFAGRGLWSSGVLPPNYPDVPAVARIARLGLSEDIAPGLYAYHCLIHPTMAGTVEVVDPGAATLSPAEVAQSGLRAAARALSAAADMSPPEPPAAAGGPTVHIGWGDGIASVNQFSPARVTVPVGTSVNWTIGSPAEGHFITFGEPPFSSPEDPAFLFPAGAAPGGEYAGGLAHSGLISMDPRFPATSYALRFTQPGTYHYVCLIHPGMEGDVVVTP